MLGTKLVLAEGKLQREGLVTHLIVERPAGRADWLCDLGETGAFGDTTARTGAASEL